MRRARLRLTLKRPITFSEIKAAMSTPFVLRIRLLRAATSDDIKQLHYIHPEDDEVTTDQLSVAIFGLASLLDEQGGEVAMTEGELAETLGVSRFVVGVGLVMGQHELCFAGDKDVGPLFDILRVWPPIEDEAEATDTDRMASLKA